MDKIAAREAVRKAIMEHLQPMIAAQVANAQGLKYLVVRNAKTGKFERVTEGRMKLLLEKGGSDLEMVEVWEKDPSVQAFTDLLNRALDKPKEQEQEIKLIGDAELIARLAAARKRTGG